MSLANMARTPKVVYRTSRHAPAAPELLIVHPNASMQVEGISFGLKLTIAPTKI